MENKEEEEDSLVINTSNQSEYAKLLSDKKNKIKKPKPKKKELIKKKKIVSKNLITNSEEQTLNIQDIPKSNVKSSHNNMNKNHQISFQNTSKLAKFSSLFKNNHEIPRVGDVEVKNTLKEELFSANQFSKLNLAPHLVDCLEKRFKLKTMTQIQEKSIPAILNYKDCFLKSQTGSGKTLAYAIPIVQRLQSYQPKIKRTDGIRALVLVPTRELAIQTCQVFEQLCNACVWIVSGSLIGGMKKKSEKDRIRRGLNILVATPGRLCDHLDTTMALNLSKIEFLVFDEADRMLDMDFEKKINFIIFKIHESKKKALAEPVIPKFKLDINGEPVEEEREDDNTAKKLDPQTILISATLTSGIKEIARRLNIVDSILIDAGADQKNNSNGSKSILTHNNEESNSREEKIALPAGLSHYYMMVPSKLRLICLISIILDKFVYQTKKTNKLVIFAATNDSVQFHEDVLRTFLNRKFNMYLDDEIYDEDDLEDSEFLHKKSKNTNNNICELFSLYGNMDQHKRAEILAKFCKTNSGVLICTDVAARGLDMPNVDWIIQYNTPGSCIDYVHRVGRTARVGHKGKAVIFLEPCEVDYLQELNKLGISLNEIKIESAMDCLNEEAKYYPRQVNSDRLVIGKNAEDVANSIQFYIEEYVQKTEESQALARKAYLSFLRSYSCYSHEWKRIFHIKKLHTGHVAKSFGLRQAPNQIVGNELKLFKGSNQNNHQRREKISNTKSKNDEEYDRLSTKYARDLKRLTNNHKEYGNVAKKNKIRSQKVDIDLSGLLRNHKNVSEFSSGLDNSKRKREISNDNRNKFSSSFSSNASSTSETKAKKIKIIKKNMDIFE